MEIELATHQAREGVGAAGLVVDTAHGVVEAVGDGVTAFVNQFELYPIATRLKALQPNGLPLVEHKALVIDRAANAPVVEVVGGLGLGTHM